MFDAGVDERCSARGAEDREDHRDHIPDRVWMAFAQKRYLLICFPLAHELKHGHLGFREWAREGLAARSVVFTQTLLYPVVAWAPVLLHIAKIVFLAGKHDEP